MAKQENAQIKCIVDANPPEGEFNNPSNESLTESNVISNVFVVSVEFKWTFNNSAESIDVAASHVSRHGK